MIMAMLKMRIRPTVRLRKSTKKRLHCARLQETEVCNSFRCSLANQLENIESLLGMEGTTDDKWSSLSASLHDTAGQSIGYSRKKHQDWFDENSTHISTLLNSMHKAHKASLNNPSSATLKTKWQDQRREDQAMIVQRWGEHFEALLNQLAPVDVSVLEELPTLPTIQSLDLPPSFSELPLQIAPPGMDSANKEYSWQRSTELYIVWQEAREERHPCLHLSHRVRLSLALSVADSVHPALDYTAIKGPTNSSGSLRSVIICHDGLP
ncbi:hypothetical protein SKAU_G00066350 [Synaphobranchus kaupii]|uniref:Uncharacterized protein n=1 Tax=Synaphobranchus kaupii TaxID=118154 RepID=A0A9Q1G7G2_SYNKA|nr:hypothetical protein SKAU_G00066350 [Synaphobranchus kaupii]